MQITGQITGGIWDRDDDRVKRIVVDFYEKQYGIETTGSPCEIDIYETYENGYHDVSISYKRETDLRPTWTIPNNTVDEIVNSYLLDLLVERL